MIMDGRQIIENLNYYSDYRITCSDERWWKSIDTNRMTATVDLYYDDREEQVTVPIEFEVCPVCCGKGGHVNPSIDCGGLTAEDFAEDPDFLEEYMGGTYDQTCNLCRGERVVPVCKDDAVNKKLEEQATANAEFRAEQAAERRMGA